jgi:endonuclease/exonuclease/phosphatase family metal-dependent hydrolase
MRIYSWNICDSNSRLERVLSFITDLQFDILCLQEVPEDFLSRLKALPYNCAYYVDLERHFPGHIRKDYLVILTPYKITDQGGFITSKGLQQPLRTRYFVQAMKLFGWSEIDNHGGIWADIGIPVVSVPVRVFSLHLRSDGPSERTKEVTIAGRYFHPEAINIVCGDFNVIDSPWLKIFNWIMGSSIKEGMPWYPERELFEDTFRHYHLVNPLKGRRTHTLFNNQLDHILLSEHLRILNAEVLSTALGSDHYPIMVEGQESKLGRPI